MAIMCLICILSNCVWFSFKFNLPPLPNPKKKKKKKNACTYTSHFIRGVWLFSHTEMSSIGHMVGRTVRGIKIYAMRHGKRISRLNRPPDQRKALVRSLTTQLLRYGRIKTTLPRARAIRRFVDKMITLAKDGSLHKRRQALGFIYDKIVVHCMFAEAPKRYADRNGGYTRIMKTFSRRGDNAPMAYIELV